MESSVACFFFGINELFNLIEKKRGGKNLEISFSFAKCSNQS